MNYKKLKDAGEILEILPHKNGMLVRTKNDGDMIITPENFKAMQEEAVGDSEKKAGVSEFIKDEKSLNRSNTIHIGNVGEFTGEIHQIVRNYDQAKIENITEGDTHNH